MPNPNINSDVVLFDSSEYGYRLVFKNGFTNPRDTLGKIGVTVHNPFTALFYRTITIEANVINEAGTKTLTTLRLNRNSLIKYLKLDPNKPYSDTLLLHTLNQSFWRDDNNKGTYAKAAQSHSSGPHHAGMHNKKSLRTWFTATIKASFLGWLYQVTIKEINRLLARLIFVKNEKDLFDAGEDLAIHRYHDAKSVVPAYQKHVKDSQANNLAEVPVTDKKNYIKPQEHDAATHNNGKYPEKYKKDTSTGTTGKPTPWVRGENELEAVKQSLSLAAKLIFGKRQLTYINAFALGPWATGLTGYELMRETGSVFATGPDKDKIIEQLSSIKEYKEYQLKRAVDALINKFTPLKEDKDFLISLINNTLYAKLNNETKDLKTCLFETFYQAGPKAREIMHKYSAHVIDITEKLNSEKQQIIIAGYPPFFSDLINYAKAKGLDMKSLSVVGIVGGQAISEAMRDKLMSDGFKTIYSSYGASDLDINLGVETEYEIAVRKALEQNPGLCRELYGTGKGLPIVFHYDPLNYHVECDKNDDLIFTCTRNDRSSPRIRYNLGDKGRVYASSDVQASLQKYGIFVKPRSNLPLLFVWGRDATVVYRGANLDFTELERAVTNQSTLDKIVTKKAFYKVNEDKFEIWFELKDGEPLPTQDELNAYAQETFKQIAELNQDFRWQLSQVSPGDDLPTIRFYQRGTSPIAEAGGQRKQVLVFEKGVNLDKDYAFPQETSTSVTLKKSAPYEDKVVLPNK